ncbi:uncharacterized protein LOC131806452 [Musca domestica]|uniref:Uncharacterized protein LOC131806452 n=1 Tax=Musca domestica TaxID=7370 RepID=A0A1I8MKH1_MUSDO|nr:uncharacterized protein LOC131806452 [Musca domestica]
MIQKPPLLKLRNLKELQCSQKLKAEAETQPPETPAKQKKPVKKKVKLEEQNNSTPPEGLPDVVVQAQQPPPTTGKRTKSARKEPPPNQLRINAFFKTCEKTYRIEPLKEEPTPFRKSTTEVKKLETDKKTAQRGNFRSKLTGRKRLFVDDEDDDALDKKPQSKKSSPNRRARKTNTMPNNNSDCVNLISDSEVEEEEEDKQVDSKTSLNIKPEPISPIGANQIVKHEYSSDNNSKYSTTTSTLSRPKVFDSGTSGVNKPISKTPSRSSKTSSSKKTPHSSRRKPKPCPPYKIVEGTRFAVDAFQYGYIEGVDYYFLTHFHADHYIGLTRKFAKPLYMSSITARLVRTFIPIEEKYIHELPLNEPVEIDDIQVTALDANHCPGAIMLMFQSKKPERCILHTGDFRAYHGMEEGHVFWNNTIDTIYLDTTYLSEKYAFCTQYESIDRAKHLIDAFRQKHSEKRILYVCGSYVIGKEKFWSSLAEEYELKVWTEENRSKALRAIDEEKYGGLLVESPRQAQMHVISMGKISYLSLVEYFSFYEQDYDILLAIRPSGWEKDTRPQYRGKINIIGIEYSEHSSYKELKRFVRFLKPQKVISTVPVGRDLMVTANVPENWYKYEKLQISTNYQPRIDQYCGRATPQRKQILLRKAKMNSEDLEKFVSPLKQRSKEINNNNKIDKDDDDVDNEDEPEINYVPSESASAYEFDPPLKLKKSEKTGKIKKEKVSPKKEVKVKANGAGGSPCKKAIKKSQKKMANETSNDVVLSQTLKEGESCSLFITNSSDYFETTKPVVKTRGNRRRISSSSSEEFEVSQKRQPRVNGKSKTLQTIDEEPSKSIKIGDQDKKKAENVIEFWLDGPSTSKEAAKWNNPLLKSSTTSTSSHEDTTSTLRFPREKPARNEEIPASQNTLDLENTHRPLRDKFKYLSLPDIVPASQTSKDLESTPRPLRNKVAWREFAKTDNEIIPASQTTADLANTPRPIRNKRKNSKASGQNSSDSCSSPPKRILNSSPENDVDYNFEEKNHHRPPSSPAPAQLNASQILTKIPNKEEEEAEDIDIYNTSQLISKVVALADKKVDTSVDHIPPELLSDPDADDDWME